MHVHITYTGGTIGMVDSPHGLVPGADLEGWLDSQLASTPLARSVSVTSLEPLIDSSNATPLSWQAIVDDLRAHAAADPQTAFVILHGTDTMAYTSAALSYALTDLRVPVVVASNVADPAGRWTLILFVIVIVMMVAGWYAVRGRIRGDLLDEVLADEVDGSASTSTHEA